MGRRTKGLGSLIKLKNSPFWQARFYDNMGRKISISTKTKVKQEAEAFLRKQMGDVRDKGMAPLSDMRRLTYGNLRAGLFASYAAKGNKSLRTRATGVETIPGLPQLDEYFGYSDDNPGPSAVAIGTDVANDFVKQRKGEGAGNAVINNSLACLRRMLRLAQQQGKIATVPFIQFEKPPKARGGFVEMGKFEELWGLLPTHLKPYVCFLYHCGGRRGEAEQLDWAQVDLQHGLIVLEETKNDDPRIVPLPAQLINMLVAIEPKEGRVFDTTNIRKEWMKACAACGLGTIIEVEGKPYDPRYKGLTVHDLRRSAVRNLVTIAGVPERIAMKITGHKTRSVFDRYHIVNTEDVQGAMAKWELAAQNLPPQKLGYSKGKPVQSVLSAKPRKLLQSK
jgi:integrase